MRLGIFGGTFDPVHLGHLLLAETCRETCSLDQVVFVPCAHSPHKQDREPTPGAARLEMLRFAIGGNECFSISDFELQRGGISYSVDTLESIRQERAEAELFFLLGADSLTQFHLWKQPERICELVTLVVIQRPGSDPPVVCTESISRLPESGVRMVACAAPLIDISSSDIRDRVRSGRSIRYRTPRAVEEYIRARAVPRQLSRCVGLVAAIAHGKLRRATTRKAKPRDESQGAERDWPAWPRCGRRDRPTRRPSTASTVLERSARDPRKSIFDRRFRRRHRHSRRAIPCASHIQVAGQVLLLVPRVRSYACPGTHLFSLVLAIGPII